MNLENFTILYQVKKWLRWGPVQSINVRFKEIGEAIQYLEDRYGISTSDLYVSDTSLIARTKGVRWEIISNDYLWEEVITEIRNITVA